MIESGSVSDCDCENDCARSDAICACSSLCLRRERESELSNERSRRLAQLSPVGAGDKRAASTSSRQVSCAVPTLHASLPSVAALGEHSNLPRTCS